MRLSIIQASFMKTFTFTIYMKIVVSFFCLLFMFSFSTFAQEDKITIDSLEITNTSLLFQKYDTIGMHCKKSNGFPKHCEKEFRLLDNNIDDLLLEQENSLSYLIPKYELLKTDDLQKEIYSDKKYYRYTFSAKPIISSSGNSCFANPGSLLMQYYVYDRLLEKKYLLDLNYAFYICDIQVLVNALNKSHKKSVKKKK